MRQAQMAARERQREKAEAAGKLRVADVAGPQEVLPEASAASEQLPKQGRKAYHEPKWKQRKR